MTDALNVAVVGLGRMGRIYARTVRHDVEGANLQSIVDPAVDPESDVLSELDGPHVFAEVEEALAVPDLDAVIIATPTSTHRDLVVNAARAGKAIFCEKPLALTLEATHEALKAVEEAGVYLQVGFMRRFDAEYQRAQKAIHTGKIGHPITFKSVGRDPFCPNPAFADPAHSGGLISDMAIHDFDVARWLMGSEVERVSAEGSLLVCEGLRAVGDIDNAVINLRFADGALGNVEVSRNAFYGYDVRTEVLGTEGMVRVDNPAQSAEPLIKIKEGELDHSNYLMDRFGEAYRTQIHRFVECVRGGRKPPVTGADALAAFEIALAATYSAREGEPVSLSKLRARQQSNLAIS